MDNTTIQAPPDGDVILSSRYVAALITLTIISVTVVWLRVLTRRFVSRNLGWDDWIMLLASVSTSYF